MIKQILILCFVFLFGFFLILGLSRKQRQSIPTNEHVVPTPTHVILSPPKNAKTGLITETIGKVEKIPWDSSEGFSSSPGGILVQGDEIETKEHSNARVNVENIHCALSEKSLLLMGNLSPETLLLQQKKGTIHCDVKKTENAVSFRISGALMTFSEGEIESRIKENLTEIVLVGGTATLAFVDGNNQTHVWELHEGDTAVITHATDFIQTTGILLQ